MGLRLSLGLGLGLRSLLLDRRLDGRRRGLLACRLALGLIGGKLCRLGFGSLSRLCLGASPFASGRTGAGAAADDDFLALVVAAELVEMLAEAVCLLGRHGRSGVARGNAFVHCGLEHVGIAHLQLARKLFDLDFLITHCFPPMCRGDNLNLRNFF